MTCKLHVPHRLSHHGKLTCRSTLFPVESRCRSAAAAGCSSGAEGSSDSLFAVVAGRWESCCNSADLQQGTDSTDLGNKQTDVTALSALGLVPETSTAHWLLSIQGAGLIWRCLSIFAP